MFRIPKYYDDYHGLWRSTQSFLECVYVIEGVKRCSLEFFDEESMPSLRDFCKMHNLYWEMSDYKILSHTEKAKGGFSNACSRVPADSPGGQFAVFLSRDRMDAELTKHYYGSSNHAEIGPLLGYPPCCTQFFSRYLAQASRNNMDFIKYALVDTRQYCFYTNRALRYFDIALISHFPCALDCAASQEIGRQRLAILRNKYPQIASFCEKHLKSMVLYTDEQGVFFSNDYSVHGEVIRYGELHGTIESDLFGRFQRAGELVAKSHNRIQVEGEMLEGSVNVLLFN